MGSRNWDSWISGWRSIVQEISGFLELPDDALGGGHLGQLFVVTDAPELVRFVDDGLHRHPPVLDHRVPELDPICEPLHDDLDGVLRLLADQLGHVGENSYEGGPNGPEAKHIPNLSKTKKLLADIPHFNASKQSG